ncbi:MAG: Methyltransferase, partial [Bryobacterales bacterium]|nr:Methyltransferase [Bryobacterales bacterium]
HPVVIRVMERLIEAWPRALHFEELMEHVGGNHRTAQCEILLATFAAGLVQLHMWRPVFSTVPGERPVASPLARLQAESGSALTTLRHTSVEAKGRLERKLITLLDGTRDLAALRLELGDEASQGQVEDNLLKTARLGLLL